MTEDVENLVLAHLRPMHDVLDCVADDVVTLKDRVGNLERSLAQIHVTLADHSGRMDRIEMKLTRIETRLDLVKA